MGKRPDRRTFEMRLTEMVNALRNDIEQGSYPPGAYLPSEKVLTKQFRLSGKSVAKGLDQLEAEGLIVKKHRIGSMVKRDFGKTPAAIHLAVQHSVFRDADLASLLDDFAKRYPDIRVNVTPFEPADHESVADYAQAEQFDMILLSNRNFDDIVLQNRHDFLQPVEMAEGTYRFLHKVFALDGVGYAQPFICSPIVLCYNRRHFRDASIPEPDSDWTWSDLFEQAGKLSAFTGRYGFYFHYLSDNRWPIFLLQRGIRFGAEPAGTAAFCRDAAEAFSVIRESMQDNRVVPPFFSTNNTDVNMLFDQGKVSMMMTSYWGLNDLKQSALDFDIAPMPYFDDPVNLLLCVGLAICKHSKETEAAKVLADYLLSEEAQRKIKEHTLSIPAVKAAAENVPAAERLNRPSRFALYRELIPSYRLHRDLGLPNLGLEKIRERLKFFWPKLESAEEMRVKLEEML